LKPLQVTRPHGSGRERQKKKKVHDNTRNRGSKGRVKEKRGRQGKVKNMSQAAAHRRKRQCKEE